MKRKIHHIAVLFLVVCFIWAILQLPYYYPSLVPSYSSSYEVGYNNKVAIIIVWIAMLMFAIMGFFTKIKINAAIVDNSDNNKISSRHLKIALFISILFIIVCYICVGDDLNNGGESGYFIFSLKQMEFGLVPYKDFAFLYGPLFAYIPYLFLLIIKDVVISYLLSLALISSIGLVMFYYIVNTLKTSPKIKIIVFYLVFIFYFPICLGLNYQITRCIVPFWGFIFLDKFYRENNSKLIWIILSSILIAYGCGPEVGIINAIAILCYFFMHLLFRKDKKALLYIGLTIIASIAFIFVFKEMFVTLLTSSSGVCNFPIVLSWYVILFLLLLFISGFYLGCCIKDYKLNIMNIAIILYIMGILPACLGRCDFGHIYTYCIMLFPMVISVISQQKFNRVQTCLIILFALISIFPKLWDVRGYLPSYANSLKNKAKYIIYNKQDSKFSLFGYSLESTIPTSIKSKIEKSIIKDKLKLRRESFNSLFKIPSNATITMPYLHQNKRDHLYYEQLWKSGFYRDLYFTKIYFSATQNVVDKRLQELRNLNVDYLLMEKGWDNTNEFVEDNRIINLLFQTKYTVKPYRYSCKMFDELNKYIKTNYVLDQYKDDWYLYKRKKI